jgi:hypothetical protein
MTIPYDPSDWINYPPLGPLPTPVSPVYQVSTPTYAQLPLCVDPGTHYFQLDQHKEDTAVCTRCGLIRKATA